MASTVEVDRFAGKDDKRPATPLMDFPSWTRADDNDNVRGSRSERLRRRSIKRDNQAKKRENDDVAPTAVTAHQAKAIDSKGLLKDLSTPVATGTYNALDQNGKEKRGWESESSDGEKKNDKKKNKHPKPAPIQTQPPVAANPAAALPSPALPASPALSGSPASPASPDPPHAAPPHSPQAQPPPPLTSSVPENSQPTGGWINPAQPPAKAPSDTNFGSRMSLSPLIPSSTPAAEPTTTKRPLTSLTPIVTVPILPYSSDRRKGVNILPTAESVVTLSTSQSPTSTTNLRSPTGSSFLLPLPDSDLTKAHRHEQEKGNVHPKVEMALISLGSIGASIIVAFIGWLIWRCHRRRRDTSSSRSWKEPSVNNISMDRPKLLVTNALSRVPILKDRIVGHQRGWKNLDRTDLGPFNEKGYMAQSMPTQQSNPTDIHVQTGVVGSSLYPGNARYGTGFHVPKESISLTEPQFNNNSLPSGAQLFQKRLSDISSLSSGFGDGQFITDAFNSSAYTADNTAAETTVKSPLPVAKRGSVGHSSQRRDTVYTEASEDMPPRFRSVNSWVRQQTGRVNRAMQRDEASDAPPVPSLPPEQDFGLMMPDGEEPRRVDSA
ncbi:hypothetical protein ED733_002335 [Metarhizium rileyi]|uniref:Uncharacterized protein n=1 Tax=Metarhizium rileyi (strain RCEF 4871) TaxID=1649241 RepID=A0A5C6G3E9_METRR|nr:hypothetical protein ED733_002335 [Metarhizium rileyi]